MANLCRQLMLRNAFVPNRRYVMANLCCQSTVRHGTPLSPIDGTSWNTFVHNRRYVMAHLCPQSTVRHGKPVLPIDDTSSQTIVANRWYVMAHFCPQSTVRHGRPLSPIAGTSCQTVVANQNPLSQRVSQTQRMADACTGVYSGCVCCLCLLIVYRTLQSAHSVVSRKLLVGPHIIPLGHSNRHGKSVFHLSNGPHRTSCFKSDFFFFFF